jgi:hypothetical protein
MIETGIKTAMIVTKNNSELIKTEDKTIEVIPSWKYFLDSE